MKSAPKGSSSFLSSLFPGDAGKEAPAPAESLLESRDESARPEPELTTRSLPIPDPAPELTPTPQFFPPKGLSANHDSDTDDPPPNWREQLSERVVSFRKRRARLQPGADTGENLELAFDDPSKPEDPPSIFQPQEATEDTHAGFDLEMGKPDFAQKEGELPGETRPFPELAEDMQLDAASEDSDEMSLGEPVEKSPPMEILVGSPSMITPEDDPGEGQLFYAPVNRRLVAGLTDALILILGAALFGGIFWYSMTRFCNHGSLVPLNMAILGLIALIVIFAYFAIFTAFVSATPGLLWMGCEIRNLRGEHPTLNESLWRAFGVLVSLSALMVGFIWAYVDSDNLTWHDRMSGTIITEAQIAPGLSAGI